MHQQCTEHAKHMYLSLMHMLWETCSTMQGVIGDGDVHLNFP